MSNLRKQFSNIYDKYVDKIYRFIFLKVNSRETAEDLTAEVFLKGWEAFRAKSEKRKAKSEIENIQAFLYQIARNLIVDYYRERDKAKVISTEYLQNVQIPASEAGLEEKAMLSSDFDKVRIALTNLKEEYREVIIWYYLDELSVSEIAKMLNKSEEAVRVLVHRALQTLKNQLLS